jgi:peptide/nickel transport system substrate-binding protein
VRARPLAALASLALVGCSGGDEELTPSPTPSGEAGEGGTLTWVVAEPVRSLDPLLATDRSAQIVSRQIHEPLIERLSGPFGDGHTRTGLARTARPAAGATVWVLHLRAGVRFQNGEVFDASAVQANAERWLATTAGRELLPELLAVDSPTPASVRFILSSPDPALPRRLASPRLGIVSPRALAEGFGRVGSEPFAGSGTGAFELREASPDRLLLARNTAWWGTGERLGPALEQVIVRAEPSGAVRAALLDSGDAQLADQLDTEQARFVRQNPLLATLPAPGGLALGLERSVRGVRSATEIPSLAGAWLTTVDVAD